MRRIFKPVVALVVMLATSSISFSQKTETAELNRNKVYHDNALGISFQEIGKVERVDSSGFRIALTNPDRLSATLPVARIFVSDRLFVDLPGSYGGRLYLDSRGARHFLSNIAYTDTAGSAGLTFTRQYWTVYAGMGNWESVINCYTKKAGNYYIVSLTSETPLGKPGEYVAGKQLTSKQLESRLLSSMTDTSSAMVQQFNELITSFQIER